LLNDDAEGISDQATAILAASIPQAAKMELLRAQDASEVDALFVGIREGRVRGVRTLTHAVLASPRLSESERLAILNVGSVSYALKMEKSLLDAKVRENSARRVNKHTAATEALKAWADLIHASSLSGYSKKRLLAPLTS